MSMPPPEDVTMTDEKPTTSTIDAPTNAPSDTPSQPRRTDHDWQLYFIPDKPLPQLRPHPSQDLISLYRLDDIHASVRRNDPVTGSKINKIRKSYEGKVKQLHIAGVNKAVSEPKEFTNGGILDWPDLEWEAQKVAGRPVQKGATADFLTRLDRAVQMAPGSLPPKESDKWRKLIGTDDVVKGKLAADASKKTGILPQAQSARPSAAPEQEPRRPQRVAKRAYSDDTFAGYKETGFSELSDDEIPDRGSGQRKRQRTATGRKDLPVNSPLGQNAYNVGLMAGGARR